MDAILDKYANHALASTRQAAVVWMLSIMKLCGTLPSVQERLRNIQRVLLSLVGEADEITQVT